MSLIYNGFRRSLFIYIFYNGNLVKTYNGQEDFTSLDGIWYPLLTNDQFKVLSNTVYNKRLKDLQDYVEALEQGVNFTYDVIPGYEAIVYAGVCETTTSTTSTTSTSTTSTTTSSTSTTSTTTSTTSTSTTSTTSSSTTTTTTTDISVIVDQYGYLYNWYAGTNAANIANTGWHNVTVTDLVNLRNYLDPVGTTYSNIAGGAMKTTGTTDWQTPNTGATNSSGLSVKGSGSRDSGGQFSLNRGQCWIWNTQDLGGEGGGGISVLIYNNATFTCESGYVSTTKRAGATIRLKKDTPTSGTDGTIVTNGYTGNDGRQYDTVIIDGYEWLNSNSKETQYRDHSAIPELQDNTAWANDVTGARCYYII